MGWNTVLNLAIAVLIYAVAARRERSYILSLFTADEQTRFQCPSCNMRWPMKTVIEQIIKRRQGGRDVAA